MKPVFIWLALAFSVAAATTSTTSSKSSKATSSATGTQCYWVDGSVSTESFRCDNSTSGHSTCCQAGAVCYSNGVCKVVNGNTLDWQRVGCTDSTWNDPACLDQCQKYQPGSSAGIRPCDGIDKGNHYCCDPGPYIGSFACCENSTNIFVLGTSIPTVLAQMPLSQLSTSTSSTTTATNPATDTSTITSTGTGDPSNTATGASGSDSSSGTNVTAVGVGVGLGVGIPLAAAVAGAFWFFSRRAARSKDTALNKTNEPGSFSGSPSMPMASAGTTFIQQQQGYQQVPSGGGGGWDANTPQNQVYQAYNPAAAAYNNAAAAQAPYMPKYGGPTGGLSEMGEQNAPVELPDPGIARTELPASTPPR